MAWFRRRRGRHERGTPLVATATTVPAYAVPVPRLRVELGFRDGSTADLPPGSPQWQALQATAAALTVSLCRPAGRDR